MPETAAAPTAVESNTNVNPAAATTTAKYQISDDALKSLRTSRHSRRNTVSRNHSGNSKQSREQSPTQQSRRSNRSSSSSLWSNVMAGRGRRIYGSAVSVASSITLTEFAGDFSEEFELSEHSLDVRQFSADNNDSKPNLPQRQCSVTAGQSSSLMSNTSNLLASDHTSQTSQDASAIPPPPMEYKRSSDLSPKQPDRKTSLAANSTEHHAIAASIARSLATQSTTPAANLHGNDANNCVLRPRSTDCIPQYPSRKKSSKVMEPQDDNLFEDPFANLREQAQVVRETLPLTTLTQDGKTYDSAFTAATAIDHLLQLGYATTRQDAVDLARTMELELGLFYHVLGRPFRDDTTEIYQLAPSIVPPSPCLVSVRRKTDTSISIEEEAPLEERTAKQLTIPPSTPKTTLAKKQQPRQE